MSACSFSVVALLLSTPLVALAQTTTPEPAYRFYGGLAAYDGSNQSINGFYSGQRVNVPVQATLGYQVRPRLAVELGFAYSGAKFDYADTDEYLNSNAQTVNSSSTTSLTRRSSSTSLLARYTFTRKASHRFQVDAAGGLSLNHSFYRRSGTNTYATQGVIEASSYDNAESYNSLRLNLGPSFRYRFGERLEAVGDILFNVALTNDLFNPNTSVALGLRYRFGKPS